MYIQRKDLLQLMMDATDEDMKGKLSTGQIGANSVEFLLAGYETTSSALTFTTLLLATNPKVQERVANEIRSYFVENPVSLCMHQNPSSEDLFSLLSF